MFANVCNRNIVDDVLNIVDVVSVELYFVRLNLANCVFGPIFFRISSDLNL